MENYYGICMIVAVAAVAIYALMNFGTFAILKAIEWYKRTRSKETERAIDDVVIKLAAKAIEVIKEIKKKEETKKNTVDFKRKEEPEEDVDFEDLLPYWDSEVCGNTGLLFCPICSKKFAVKTTTVVGGKNVW